MNSRNYSSDPRQAAYDILVVGNGALGLSLGLVLARRGHSVVIVGEEHRPYGASGAAGAMLGCFGEVGPSTLTTPFGRAKLQLDYRASREWPTWLESLGEESALGNAALLQTARGTLVIHNTIGHPEIDDDSWSAIRQALQMFDEPFEEPDPKEFEWLDPQPTARPLRAMFIPNEHAVDSGLLLRALEQSLIRAGADLISGTVQRVTLASGQVCSVELSGERSVSTRLVVLAAGARSQVLLDTLPDVSSEVPRLISGPGIAALLEQSDAAPALPNVIRTSNRAFACGLHAVPRSDGTVYV
ncbi:MAG: NAD(P)/FAD-dependent oxidoreductase, partial [Thermoanaerobaculia bacterium]